MKLRKILSVLFILLILFNVSLAQRPESSVGTRIRFTLRNVTDIATFGTPPSGALYLYAQDDTTLRYKDADGVVHILAQFTNDSLYIDSLHFNLAWGDSLWANWAQILKLTDGTATLEGGDLTGLDSLQVSKVGAYTLYGQLSGNQQNITNVNEFTADSIAVARLDADSSYLGILGENLDANQKNITDLNKLNTDSTSAFVVDGNLDLNQNNILDVNEITVDSAAIARLDADSSFLGILGENLDGNQKNITDINKVLSDTTGIGVFYANVDGNQKNITDLNKVVSDTLNDGTATLTAGALSGITTIGMNNQLTNTLADGTTPMVITSTTKVSNLNVDRVDGVHLASLTDTRLMRYESTGTQIENATVTETSGALGGITTIGMSGQLTNSLAIGTSPFAVTSTTVNTNLNADLLDAKSEAAFATLAEAETVSGKYTFSDTLIASKAVKGADGVLLTNESATKATLPSNTSWMYPYDDGSSVHLVATKDDNGTETVVKIAEQSSITNLSSGGAFYSGDGTDDYITIADNANLRFGTGNFGLIFKNLRLPDYTPTAVVTLARKANNAASDTLGWILTLETDGKPQIAFGNGINFTTLAYKSATAINATDATTIHLAAIITRETASVAGSVKFYQFGYDTWKLLSSVAITAGTPQTVTETTPSALVLFQNINGATEYAFQSFGGFIPCNFAPTYAEVKEFIEKGIPAKYQWGSQTLVIDSDFTGDLDGWNAANSWGSQTNPANNMVLSATDGEQSCRTDINLIIEKRYRVTYTASSLTGTIYFSNFYTSGYNVATISEGTHSAEFTKVLSAKFYIISTASGNAVTLDNISVVQIGAVAAYLPENMTASTAYDASSNNLDGSVLGATLLNAKVADAFRNPQRLPTDDAVLSVVDYSGYDGSSIETQWGKVETFQRSVLNGQEAWGYKLSGIMAGTMRNLWEWDLSGVANDQGTLVFNEDSKDIDVRIESDINNAISVDGATGNVILGAAADIVGALTAGSVVSDADVTGATVASITAANLLDKSANESISGVYTFTNLGGALVVNDSAFVDTLTSTVGKFTKLSSTGYGSDNTVSDAELLYINSLSSNAQDQFNLKAPLANPTFTGSFTSPGIDDNADAIAITIDVTTGKVNMSAACDVDGALTANVYNYYTDTSSVNDSWGFTAAAIGAYTTGLSIFVNIGVANTDGATLQINALGAKAVLKMHDTALATNNVEAGQIIHLIYDGTQFQMLSQVAN